MVAGGGARQQREKGWAMRCTCVRDELDPWMSTYVVVMCTYADYIAVFKLQTSVSCAASSFDKRGFYQGLLLVFFTSFLKNEDGYLFIMCD